MTKRDQSTRRPFTAILATALAGLAPMLAGIGALGGLHSRNEGEVNSLNPTGESAMLSVRRVNATLSQDVAVADLRVELGDFTAGLSEDSCLSVRVGSRDVIEFGRSKYLIPASNIKIVTALVALDVLGPGYRFKTSIVGEMVDGVVEGDAFVVGGGDPVLSLPNYPDAEQYPTLFFTDVTKLLDAAVTAGLKRIDGSLVGDGSLFDSQRFPSGWSDDIRYVYGGPIGALLLDDGYVFGLASKPDDPAYAASLELSARLRNLGVNVRGSALAGTAPDGLAEIASIESASLSEIVAEMLTNSDNNTAEMLLKSVGLAVKGVASTAAGAEVAMETLKRWGFDTSSLVISDGSGLDRSNRLTCELFVDLLSLPTGAGLVSRMAVGGTSGTLIDAFTEPPALGVVRAKTGSLTGVKALSGFASERAGAPVFSLVMNGGGVNDSAYFRPKWTELLTHLYTYPRSVNAGRLDIESQ